MANEKKICKDCGDEFGKPTTDCPHDCNDPKGSHWKMETNEGLADLADRAERDHEVQMARSDLYKIAKYAIKLHEMMKGISEAEGIEGWQQAKITKAADYLGSVYHSLDYEVNMETPKLPESVKPKKFKKILSDSQVKSYKGSLASKLAEAKGVCPDCGKQSWKTLNMTREQIEEGERHGNDDIYDKCWAGYERVPGTKRGEKGSCRKKGSK